MKKAPDINDTLQAEGVDAVRARHDRAKPTAAITRNRTERLLSCNRSIKSRSRLPATI